MEKFTICLPCVPEGRELILEGCFQEGDLFCSDELGEWEWFPVEMSVGSHIDDTLRHSEWVHGFTPVARLIKRNED